jgi:uncharacterized repeat protein (TIGR03803 family)
MARADRQHRNFSGMDFCRLLTAMAGTMFLLFVAAQAQAQTFTVLHTFSFGGLDGSLPAAGVTLDVAGRVYGATYEGGPHSWGVVYRLSPSAAGWTETVLYSFRGGTDGGMTMSRVLFGPDGILYGTEPNGGPSGGGTVFSLTPPPNVCHAISCPWTKTVLYSFTGGSDGAGPQGDLLFDAAGNIYGAAAGGGTGDNGVIFKLTRSGSTWTESVLYSFTGGSDGCQPSGGPIFDRAGNLYGTTLGNFCRGTVYKLTPSESGWTETTLYTFTEQDLGFANGLTIDAQGNLFGLTGRAGGTGVAYELRSVNGNWTYSRLAILPQGFEGPYDVPTLDAQGNLYGTLCCTFPDGGVFKLTPSGLGWDFANLYSFSGGSDGGLPTGGVTFDRNGNLYGTASGGGQGKGTVWEITP